MRGRAFGRRGRLKTRDGAFTIIDRFRLRGRFSYGRGYRMDGRWHLQSQVLRGRRRITVCSQDSRFGARLVSGPIGIEGPHPTG